jgi:DNA modification methylase
MTELPRNTILIGDAVTQLRQLPSASVDCVVTSPPFYMLRDYAMPEQLGLEPTVGGWVTHLREVMAEVARVLKPTGSAWLNLGDSYSRASGYGAPPKSFLLGPERLVLALASDGWTIRNKVVWSKPNPIPTSVRDRLNATYEFVYLLTRSRHYFFDLDAIREPHLTSRGRAASRPIGQAPAWAGPLAGSHDGLRQARAAGMPGHPLGKNPGDVWRIATKPYRGAHFATFPEALVRRPILAGCPEAVCIACGKPWLRRRTSDHRTGVLVPCQCGSHSRPGVVLDPFMGTGTVPVVARATGRDWIGIELNPAFARMAFERLAEVPVATGKKAA